MKRVLLPLFFLMSFGFGQAQDGFSLEGTLGAGFNGSKEPVNAVLIEGRMHFNENFSTSLGLGLWYSGYSRTWNSETETQATIYKLSDSKAFPSLQWGFRGQMQVGQLAGHVLKVFAEPKLYFLPFSGRTTNLLQKYYDITHSGDELVYTPRPADENDSYFYTSACRPRLYYGIQAGLSMDIRDNMAISAGYGYSNLDLFHDLRGQSLNGFSLDNYLPAKGMHLVSITLHYQY